MKTEFRESRSSGKYLRACYEAIIPQKKIKCRPIREHNDIVIKEAEAVI